MKLCINKNTIYGDLLKFKGKNVVIRQGNKWYRGVFSDIKCDDMLGCHIEFTDKKLPVVFLGLSKIKKTTITVIKQKKKVKKMKRLPKLLLREKATIEVIGKVCSKCGSVYPKSYVYEKLDETSDKHTVYLNVTGAELGLSNKQKEKLFNFRVKEFKKLFRKILFKKQ